MAIVDCFLSPDTTSSSFQSNRPSMPPSTETHSPLMCPAARWDARKATALATSVGCAIFFKATVACASAHISRGSSNRSPINGVLTHPGATALILASLFSCVISFLQPLTRPYCRPALPLAYSECPACPNFPHSLPVTTTARFSNCLPLCCCASSAARRKCLMVKKVPRTLIEYTLSHNSAGMRQMG